MVETESSVPIVFEETLIPYIVYFCVSIGLLSAIFLGSLLYAYELSAQAAGLLVAIFLAVPFAIFAFKKKRRVLAFPQHCEVYAGRILKSMDREFYWNGVTKAWIHMTSGDDEAIYSLRVVVNGEEIVLLTRQYDGDPGFENLVEFVSKKIEPYANHIRLI